MKKIDLNKKINKETESLKRYMFDVANIYYKKHTIQEETIIINKIQSGDEQLRDQFIKNHLKFVYTVSKQYQQKNVELNDLIQEGNMGLISAINKFDTNRGVKFLSFAIWYVQKYVINYINNHATTIRIPIYRLNQINQINKLIEQYEGDNLYDLIKDFDISEAEISRINNIHTPIYLTNQIVIGEENLTLLDIYPSEQNIEEEYIKEENISNIRSIILKFPRKEKSVLIWYFGLFNSEKLDIKQISKNMNISQDIVRSLKQSGLNRLKSLLTLV